MAAWDLAIGCAVVAGYGWLVVLSGRVLAMSRRLGAHVCREPGRLPGRRVPDREAVGRELPGHGTADGRVGVADILRRERAAEITRPLTTGRERR